MLKTALRIAAEIIVASLLAITLYNGWYYWQVLKWVDAIRIEQALKQVAAQSQQAPKAP